MARCHLSQVAVFYHDLCNSALACKGMHAIPLTMEHPSFALSSEILHLPCLSFLRQMPSRFLLLAFLLPASLPRSSCTPTFHFYPVIASDFFVVRSFYLYLASSLIIFLLLAFVCIPSLLEIVRHHSDTHQATCRSSSSPFLGIIVELSLIKKQPPTHSSVSHPPLYGLTTTSRAPHLPFPTLLPHADDSQSAAPPSTRPHPNQSRQRQHRASRPRCPPYHRLELIAAGRYLLRSRTACSDR